MFALKYLLLVSFLALADIKGTYGRVNQCPQPTDSNPDPSDFVYSDPDDCSCYFTCSRGRPRRKRCKPLGRTRYSEFYHTCVGVRTSYDTCTRLHAQRECRRGLPGLIGHPTLCRRYYNCSQAPNERFPLLGEYEAECPFLHLFDIEANKCVPFKLANCGPNRDPAKDPCDYVKNKCTGSSCHPCQ